MDKPYSSFTGISLKAVPFLYAISIFLKTYAKQYLYPFLRNEYAIIVQSKTSVKFLFSFAALIFFPPHGLSFWHQPLSCRCKGMAAGFGNILLLLLVLLKNISNAFKNYLDFFIKNQRLLFHDWYSPCFSFLPPKETLASPL